MSESLTREQFLEQLALALAAYGQIERDTIAALQAQRDTAERNEHAAMLKIEELELRLANSEKAAYDVAATIDSLKQQLAAAQAELYTARQAALSEGVRAGKLQVEVDAWRSGGVTEEILRRQDGYLKVGKGCVLVREDDWNKLNEELEVLRERDSGF